MERLVNYNPRGKGDHYPDHRICNRVFARLHACLRTAGGYEPDSAIDNYYNRERNNNKHEHLNDVEDNF